MQEFHRTVRRSVDNVSVEIRVILGLLSDFGLISSTEVLFLTINSFNTAIRSQLSLSETRKGTSRSILQIVDPFLYQAAIA